MPKLAETKVKVDSILIKTQFPHRISLSQAAQISGYHQDYLGQLCRLGKLRAAKIGRNWYTTQSEIQSLLSNPAASDVAEFIQPESVAIEPMAADTQEGETQSGVQESPVVTSNYLISEVNSVPIRLEQRPQAARSHHSLQTLVTKMRLEELRTDVLQMSGLVKRVAAEQEQQKEMLMRHEQILQGRTDLRSQYVPSLGITNSHQSGVDMLEFADPIETYRPNDTKIVWLWPALAMVLAIAASSMFILSNLKNNDAVEMTTVIYKDKGQPIETIIPQVAGDQVAAPTE
ncbi:helix-turn-helix domain-containing protein [bacterium]|nr:MAG: helix-turn-helix domain-containing protein [bacterium]